MILMCDLYFLLKSKLAVFDFMLTTLLICSAFSPSKFQISTTNVSSIESSKSDIPQTFITSLLRFKDKEIGEEGCLSLPHIFGLVKRSKKIHLKYYDFEGNKIKEKIKGLKYQSSSDLLIY